MPEHPIDACDVRTGDVLTADGFHLTVTGIGPARIITHRSDGLKRVYLPTHPRRWNARRVRIARDVDPFIPADATHAHGVIDGDVLWRAAQRHIRAARAAVALPSGPDRDDAMRTAMGRAADTVLSGYALASRPLVAALRAMVISAVTDAEDGTEEDPAAWAAYSAWGARRPDGGFMAGWVPGPGTPSGKILVIANDPRARGGRRALGVVDGLDAARRRFGADLSSGWVARELTADEVLLYQ